MRKKDRGHRPRVLAAQSLLTCVLVVTAGCSATPQNSSTNAYGTSDNGGWLSYEPGDFYEGQYLDQVHGAWAAIMVANHSGLPVEGIWIDEPGPGDAIDLVLLDEWSTDDDTHVEWLDLHIMETHGIDPTYEQIRDEWIDHLNGDIWVATRAARDLMDDGLVPPATGEPDNNPDGAWSMDAQLETELFGMISPGQPDEARRRATFFAKVTNTGPAVEASAFYAEMYSHAFFMSDVSQILLRTRQSTDDQTTIAGIYDNVATWHAENDDWRDTRQLIGEAYHDDPSANDPEWWASRVNFASTMMALLYGDGDLRKTFDIAGLAGWDADNNMTTATGLLGLMIGFDGLPEPFASASDVYFNEDLSGDLPQFDSVKTIAERTVAIGEKVAASLDSVGG